jgi:hypothetical protein
MLAVYLVIYHLGGFFEYRFEGAHFFTKYCYVSFSTPEAAKTARYVLRSETNLVVTFAKARKPRNVDSTSLESLECPKSIPILAFTASPTNTTTQAFTHSPVTFDRAPGGERAYPLCVIEDFGSARLWKTGSLYPMDSETDTCHNDEFDDRESLPLDMLFENIPSVWNFLAALGSTPARDVAWQLRLFNDLDRSGHSFLCYQIGMPASTTGLCAMRQAAIPEIVVGSHARTVYGAKPWELFTTDCFGGLSTTALSPLN